MATDGKLTSQRWLSFHKIDGTNQRE